MSNESTATQYGIPRYFPGEVEAVETVKRLGAQFGYGNLIHVLKQAWADMLHEEGISRLAADMGGGLICVWCDTDCRTGKKAKIPPTMPKAKRKAVQR